MPANQSTNTNSNGKMKNEEKHNLECSWIFQKRFKFVIVVFIYLLSESTIIFLVHHFSADTISWTEIP